MIKNNNERNKREKDDLQSDNHNDWESLKYTDVSASNTHTNTA